MTKTQVKPILAFRYYCDACTGRAFYSETPAAFIMRTCKNCHKEVYYKAENYFSLDPNSKEYREVNDPDVKQNWWE